MSWCAVTTADSGSAAGGEGHPAFVFARQLRDPTFRAYLAAGGYVSGTPTLAVAADTTTRQLNVLAGNRYLPMFVARRDPGGPHGWRLSVLDPDGAERP